ncbi:MAG: IS66 family insertion sequence element accessory protein TnpB [Comamonadaceae bacterium]|jgi:hypothetical protein|nr:IS66 family insertion sequence element accessory protein TnpB [Comamonadaceae bacterium]
MAGHARYTALLDACVLYPLAMTDALMSLATAGFFAEPLDMRAGFDKALARVVQVFGAAHPHHAYLFANVRSYRMKVLVHDGFGL